MLAAFDIYIYRSMEYSLSDELDHSLTLVASQVIAGLEIENERLIFNDGFVREPENMDLREHGFTVRILALDGEVLQEFGALHTSVAPLQDLNSVPSFTTLRDKTQNDSIRMYTVLVNGVNHRIAFVQVTQSLEDIHEALNHLQTNLLVGVPLLIAMAGISGYFLAARALSRVDGITYAARRISAENLSTRLNMPMTDDEIGRLAETIDLMLARLDASFQRERQFTADASHELRTPLTAIHTILSLMREKRRTAEAYEQAFADIAEEADYLHTLIENLLRLSRSDMRTPLHHEPIDFSLLLRDVTDSWQPLAEAKSLTLTHVIPDDLGIIGDTDELIRLLINLLDNAIKYTQQGGIALSARQNGEQTLSISIADTGIGIPAEHLPCIFDRFYRVDKSRSTPGTGLGLAIALEIAQTHGGSIEVSSDVGKGTCFTVTLPKGQQA